MSEIYDATYAAVRSRVQHCDTTSIIDEIVRGAFGGISHAVDMVKYNIDSVANEFSRPSVLFKPKLCREGNLWCFILGEMPHAVCGFGETPEIAAVEFDKDFKESKFSK